MWIADYFAQTGISPQNSAWTQCQKQIFKSLGVKCASEQKERQQQETALFER